MSMKLRDLIRKVRACKTAAEERAVIAKESAMIRTAIREEQVHYRHRNVAKLLFMHMLGYPTHFGQLECMKLTASPHFPEKRIGYLGMMLLLTEEADVLMLATNALKNDLNAENKFVAGLALCAIGNLATADMSRDLAPEVDKHLKSSLPYLRKKACLAMARCLSKCPDMVEDFVERVVSLLKDKNQGVLVTVVQLMTQVLTIDFRNAEQEGEDPWNTTCRTAFVRLTPTLVKLLRSSLSSGYSGESDMAGGADPFLQVQLLTVLRLLGTNNTQASEEMNDVLAQVATNTESAKNAGNAILYECVQTIMAIESDDGLRVLAINILGRFLLNRDNNIRYVALNTLSRCVEQSPGEDISDDANNAMSTLQRHRQTVVDCLKDPDVSIRTRALELIYHLVNESNVEQLTAELLNYLVLCPREHRRDICTRILKVVDRYSPDDRWRVDTLITTLTIAGREALMEVQSATALYISRATTDVHGFCVHKLAKAIRDDDGSQHGLLATGIWCIGEYGDLLLRPYQYTPTSTATDATATTITFEAMEPLQVVDLVERTTRRHACPDFVKQRALTAYIKLTQRYNHDPAAVTKLENLIQEQQSSRSLELQVRACEYNALWNATKGQAVSVPRKQVEGSIEADLFGGALDGTAGTGSSISPAVISAAKEALARMPVVDAKILQKRLSRDEFATGDDLPRRAVAREAPKAAAPSGDLLDLQDIFGGGTSALPVSTVPNGVAAPTSGKSDLDLLSDIFAAPPVATSITPNPMDLFQLPPSTASVSAPVSNPMYLFGAVPTVAAPTPAPVNPLDLFGAPAPSPAAPMIAPMSNSMDMFGTLATPSPATTTSMGVRVPGLTHNGLTLEFQCTKPNSMNLQKSVLIVHFINSAGVPMQNMNLQVAVPKYITMEMEPPSSTVVPAGGMSNVTQKITVNNTMLGQKNLVLKVKVSFSLNGQMTEHMATCSGFPAGQY